MRTCNFSRRDSNLHGSTSKVRRSRYCTASRGAYTGALTSQVGRLEPANNSTIFLGEAIQPSTLYSRMEKLGIPHRRQKDDLAYEGQRSIQKRARVPNHGVEQLRQSRTELAELVVARINRRRFAVSESTFRPARKGFPG